MHKRGLGRGLDALLPSGGFVGEHAGSVREIPVGQIIPNRLQPRQHFDPEKMAELVESVRQHGVVQPVVVRPAENGYELIVGERRWRAAREAGLATVPAVVRDVGSDADILEVALVENLQREDLNPLEEAAAYQYLVKELGLTQEQVAQRVGRSRSQVANTLRLLGLDPEIQEAIQEGSLSMGHAKAVLSLSDRAHQRELARRIVEKGMSVREAEEAARRLARPDRVPASPPAQASPYAVVEEELREALGTRVRVRGSGGRGRVEIEFYSEEDLTRIVSVIVGPRG